MKKITILLAALVLVLGMAVPAAAAESGSDYTSTTGNVTYSGDAGEFIFQPGSEYSPTDLFPEFKDVMPGDTLTQQITVKNEASDKVNVKIYMRSLGAHEDSRAFLEQLHLTVTADDNYPLFDTAADETAQLTDWVLLGTLYSGGSVNLDVTLNVPVTLDNTFKKYVGKLDWQFMVEEFPVESDDPTLPDEPTKPVQPDDDQDQPSEPDKDKDKDKDKGSQTGDDFAAYKWLIVMAAAAAVMFVLFTRRRKEES